MKKFLGLLSCFILAVLLVMFFPMSSYNSRIEASLNKEDIGYFNQRLEEVSENTFDSYSIYYKGELVGHINDKSKLDNHLKEIYKNDYKETYPNSKLNYNEDIYITKEKSNNVYTNVDERIIDWLDSNELYSLEATYITIIDDDVIKYGIYVKDEETYQEAMDTFLSYFIDQQYLAILNQGSKLPSLTSYGSRYLSVNVDQKIVVAKRYVSKDEIMTTTEEVLEFLKYGENKEREYYTVQQYDTLAGVGSKNHGLSATQVMNINRDKISSVDQILNEGEELCVTYFTSPISISVTREVLKEDLIYYDSSFVEDSNIVEGESEIRTEGENGVRNTLYEEVWVNGVLMSGNKVSSTIAKEAKTEVIAVGTKQEIKPGVGTGSYRYPVDNAAISCDWTCYFNHGGEDFINEYDPWGNVYAVDNGVIEEVGYNGINGNYVFINHNNGVRSYYGHLRLPCELPAGTIVEKGDVLGFIGTTGVATGPHVHLTFDYGDFMNTVDPCDFFDCTGLY